MMESPTAAARKRAGKDRPAGTTRAIDVTIGDDTWRWWWPMTMRLTAEFRQVTGRSAAQFRAECATSPDVDTWGTIIWLARRQTGETVTLEQVFDEFDAIANGDITVDVLADLDSEEDPDPEG